MDRSWINMPWNTPKYQVGLNGFLDFAFERSSVEGTILCPYNKYNFIKWKTRQEVCDHLLCKPFPKTYTFWCHHGEAVSGEFANFPLASLVSLNNDASMPNIVDEGTIQMMINDAFRSEPIDMGDGGSPELHQGATDEAKEFYDLLKEGEQPLYEGCTQYTKLSFLVRLYHIKSLCGVTDKAMTMILELLYDAFEHAKIPSSNYEAKKLINKLGLSYTKIHAGPLQQARRFTAYNVNGYKFRTLQREQGMKSQNSGVFCKFGTKSYASASDNMPMEGVVSYYGKLVDIIELNYHDRFVAVWKLSA